MTLDQTAVRKIARLARLHVDDAELAALGGELNRMLGFVEQLSQVDTAGIEPMASVADQSLRLRDDRVTEGGDAAAVTANAPAKAESFFVVPKVVE